MASGSTAAPSRAQATAYTCPTEGDTSTSVPPTSKKTASIELKLNLLGEHGDLHPRVDARLAGPYHLGSARSRHAGHLAVAALVVPAEAAVGDGLSGHVLQRSQQTVVVGHL